MHYRASALGGTLMRHFLQLPFTIASLPYDVVQPSLRTLLIPLGRTSLGFPTGGQRTVATIDVAPIAATANHGLCVASGAVVEPRSVVNLFWPSHGLTHHSASLDRV